MASDALRLMLQDLRRCTRLREGAEQTDSQLLEAFRRGRDPVALEVLVRRHAPMVWGVCRRTLANHHEAEDAFQATFLVLLRKGVSIRTPELLPNWLYRVAYKTACKARQTAAKRGSRERQVSALPEPPPQPHEDASALDLRAAIDEELPPRWSRNNPVDLAGGETRDTVPRVLELVARHPDVDAVLYLGCGIQSNEARLMREGRFWPGEGLERIVAYHERQDARFAEAAADVSDATGKPVLTATELAVTDPTNPGPRTVRETGRLCYPTSLHAVRALEHLWRRARYLAGR